MFDGTDPPEAFGAVVIPETAAVWASKANREQVIGRAELFPILVAKPTWARKIAGRKVIDFIYNDSARLAMVESCSPMRMIIPSVSLDGQYDW